MQIKAAAFRNGMAVVESRFPNGKVKAYTKPSIQHSCNSLTKVHLSSDCYDIGAVIDVEEGLE